MTRAHRSLPLRRRADRLPTSGGVSMLVLVLASVVAACGTSTTASSGTGSTAATDSGPAAAEHRSWVLEGPSSGETGSVELPVAVFLEDGHLRVVLACNDGGGDYTWDGDRLVLDQLVSTLVGCGDDDAIEEITAVMRNRPQIDVDGATMTMTADSGTTLVFREIDDDRSVQQAALTGTFSVLPPDGGPPAETTITVDSTGRYRVTLGCTNLGGQLTVDSGRVSQPETSGAVVDGCIPLTETAPVDELIFKALDAAHLRRVDQGLEVLDVSGTRVALLQPVPGGDPSTTYPPNAPALP